MASVPLFVYGTLLVPEVILDVLGRVPASLPAELSDYARLRVRGRVYPGIRRHPGASTRGALLSDLSSGEMAALDVYEGGEYTQALVSVRVGGQVVQAVAYAIADENLLCDEPWNLPGFLKDELKVFRAEEQASLKRNERV